MVFPALGLVKDVFLLRFPKSRFKAFVKGVRYLSRF